jgi:biopolymer transport protein ExbD
LEYPFPTGIKVRLLRPGVSVQPSPGIQPLLVRVERDGRLYVNSELVPTERLDSLLRKELGLRPPDWPVYVEGDRDLDWGVVLDVIDRVRGLHAEVVLLTRAP